jgi:hypothetical protein
VLRLEGPKRGWLSGSVEEERLGFENRNRPKSGWSCGHTKRLFSVLQQNAGMKVTCVNSANQHLRIMNS